ncbi:MAG: hypothetical protein PHV28_17850, partial [Kiritimatiellae bacterium]|nr:hypothetical protein [Kiritimatiellia bacterium]
MMKKTLVVMMALAALGATAELDKEILLNEGKLIAVLKRAEISDNDKVTACQNLGWCGTRTAIGPLTMLLASEKPVLRHAARYGLEMIPDPEVEKAFCEKAGRLTGPALVGVLQSLGNLKPEQTGRSVWAALVGGSGHACSVVLLRGRMSDGDKSVAGAAVQSLGKIATPEAMAALKAGLGKCPCVAVAYLNGAGKVACSDAAKASAYYA